MGVIQNALNQLIGTTTTIGAGAKHFQQQQMQAKGNLISSTLSATSELTDFAAKDLADIASMKPESKEMASIAKEGAEAADVAKAQQSLGEADIKAMLAQGTGSLIQGAKSSKELGGLESKVNETLKKARDEIERRQVQMAVAGFKQESQRSQKRNFKEYLSKLEIAGGGKVGDLPKNMQSAIAKQYSKEERKELMDRMDKEGGKK